MQNSVRNIHIEKTWQHFRDIARVRGRGKFVCDCVDMFVFARPLDHAIDKTRARWSEDPGDTHHKMLVVRLQNQFLPFPLRFTVNADWICRIAFAVRLTFFSIEYVIGAEVDKLRFLVPANFREDAWRVRIDPKSLVALGLTKIDIRKRGRINENTEIDRAQFLAYLIGAFEIKLQVIEAGDVEFVVIFAHERRA